MKQIQEILDKYNKTDYQLFYDTVDMLCAKGVGKGIYQDYTVLTDIITILSICEQIIQNKGTEENDKTTNNEPQTRQ